jgi:SpoVK/Ycf46/Vps4 family AAA+-type ATPase
MAKKDNKSAEKPSDLDTIKRRIESTRDPTKPMDVDAIKKQISSTKDPAKLSELYSKLGDAYVAQKEYDKAIEARQKAIDINPKNPEAAVLYAKMARLSQETKTYADKTKEYAQKGIDGIKKRIKLTKGHAKLSELYSRLGDTYATQDEYDKAIEAHQKAIDINPKNPEAARIYARLVWLSERTKTYADKTKEYTQRAIDVIQKDIKLTKDPVKLSELYSKLGDTYYGILEKSDTAIEAYQKAVDINPKNPEAATIYTRMMVLSPTNGTYADKTIGYAQNAIAAGSKDPDLYYTMGNIYRKKREYDKAEENYRKILELTPDTAEPLIEIGYVFFRKQEYGKAEEHYMKAIELATDKKIKSRAYSSLADTYAIEDEIEKALGAYQKAIELDPENSSAYSMAAEMFARKKEYDKAVEYAQKSIELGTGEREKALRYQSLGDVWRHKGETEKALECFQKAIDLNPRYASPYDSIGRIFIDKKEYDKAIEYHLKSIELETLNEAKASTYYLIGLAYRGKGEYDKAEESYRKAIELDLRNSFLYNEMGLLFKEKGEYDKAVEYHKKAAELEPNQYTYENLADTLDAKGEHGEALKKYEQAAKISPSNDLLVKVDELKKQLGIDLELQRPQTNFSDVGGLEELKEQLREKAVYALQNPDLAKKYGQKACGGILLYGPPGCGKTYIATATAGEGKINFISVKLHELKDKWYGNTEKNIHGTFERARQNAPSILFLDEIDAIGGKRDENMAEIDKSKVNQILTEMDEVDKSKDNIIVIAATNAPWDIDPALRRTGRFNEIIYVPSPDAKGREEIFKLYTKNIPTTKDISIEELAKKTEGYSASDIREICADAARIPWKEALKTGKQRDVNQKDFETATEKRKSTLTPWYQLAEQQIMASGEKEQYKELLETIQKNKKDNTKVKGYE